MNFILDIRTLALVTALVALSIFLCLLYIALRRKTYPGFWEWTIGALLNAVGMILLSFRGMLPDVITIVSANTCIILYFSLIPRGLVRFSNAKHHTWLDVLLPLSVFLSFIFFTYILPSVTIRICIISAVITLQSLRAVKIIYFHLPNVLPQRQIALISLFAFTFIWHILRGVFTPLFEHNISDFMNAGLLQGVSFIVVIASSIVIGMMLIIINFQRLEYEFSRAETEIQNLTGLLPICSSCKKIRDDKGNWKQMEDYISKRSEASFTHSICPECSTKLYKEDIIR